MLKQNNIFKLQSPMKIRLNTETIRSLRPEQLKAAAAGDDPESGAVISFLKWQCGPSNSQNGAC